MNEILKDLIVYPKIQLSEDEYNTLVRFARMNADEIERRAAERYRANGVGTWNSNHYVFVYSFQLLK